MTESDPNISRRGFGLGVATVGAAVGLAGATAGSAQAQSGSDIQDRIAPDARIDVHPLERLATLHTTIALGGRVYPLKMVGARVCKKINISHDQEKDRVTYNLESVVTIFHEDDSALGPATVVQDPTITGTGFTHLSKQSDGRYGFPGLSYFNQHLIFMVGGRYFYYPRAWQVVAAVNSWPPEGSQYHHLEEDTPIFDYVTGEPNVARKGASTITIGRKPTRAEHDYWMKKYDEAVAKVKALPSSRLQPNPKTPAQG